MKAAAALAALTVLSGCGAEQAREPAPNGTASPAPVPTRAVPRKLIPADFDAEALGGKVEGMTVEDMPIGGRKAPLARVTAYVACGKKVPTCDPAALPEGTLYTYVLTITPVARADTADDAATPPADEPELPEPPSLTMLRPAHGFNAAAGYALAEAASAFGGENAISMVLDRKRVSWRAADGSNLAGGKPITVWWQSDQPPAKPAPSYRLVVDDRSMEITAPFPAADKPVDPTPAS